MAVRLVILDADGTLWHHRDISAMAPPFRLVERDLLVDSSGDRLRLCDGVREFLEQLKEKSIPASLASWNMMGPVEEAVELLGLNTYFTNSVVEMHPKKHEMIRKILGKFEADDKTFQPEEVLYIDDRDIHLKEIKSKVGAVRFLQIGKDFSDWYEVLDRLDGILS